MSGHFLKLHFCIFEKSQGKHNNLDYYYYLEYFSLIAKFRCSKFDRNNFFCMFKALKHQEWIIIFFSNVPFFYKMCTIPFKI
jgi:hypothetical protein